MYSSKNTGMLFDNNADIIDRLFKAIYENDVKQIIGIIDEARGKGINLNTTHPKKHVSPLHWAVLKCNGKTQDKMIAILNILFDANIDVNLGENSILQYTPLHTATRRALPDIVAWLLHHGANHSAQDNTTQTPLDYVNKSIARHRELGGSTDTHERLIEVRKHLMNPPAPAAGMECIML